MMNQKKCYKDVYAPYKWALFAALVLQWVLGGFLTIGMYANWLYVALPIAFAVTVIAARFAWDRLAVRIFVRAVTILPTVLCLAMVLFQTVASAASGWQLSMNTILWDAVRSTLPALPWLIPALGIAAGHRGRYDRVALVIAQGLAAALAIVTLVLSYLPNSAVLTDNEWGIRHVAWLYILGGVCIIALVVALVFSLARPDRRALAADDDTDTFDGMYLELKEDDKKSDRD